MQWADWYQKNKNQWWCLPLILQVVLHPLAVLCNVYTAFDGVRVVLFFMPPALMMAALMVFGWAALPGVVAALFFRYLPLRGASDALMSSGHYLIALVLSWGGYRLFVPRRFSISFGYGKLTGSRLFWLVFFYSSVFALLYQVAITFGVYDARRNLPGNDTLQITTLINYQTFLVSNLIGVPFWYFILRTLRHPHFARSFYSRLRAQMHPHASPLEIGLWAATLLALIGLLIMPIGDEGSIFNTNYTFTLILPVMIWGTMRFGFLFITTVWTLCLMVLSHYYYRYLPDSSDYEIHMAITSACYVVFSFTIYLMGGVVTRQRAIYEKVQRIAFVDPVVQMPNLRALSRDINHITMSTLCLLRFPELELLGRNYGILLRIGYMQELDDWLQEVLLPDERLYYLSSLELMLRLNGEKSQDEVEVIEQRIRQFRYLWDGMPIQPQVGISYCYIRHPVAHHPLLLGELSTMAEFSLSSSRPERLQLYSSRHAQNAIRHKVAMMNSLQRALDIGAFELQAQRVEGVRGDVFYEILLRMVNEHGEMLEPDRFLPAAHEFGMSSRIDLWVLEQAVQFIARHRDVLPGCRFSINLTPASVCRAPFASDVAHLLARYEVQAWQLIFEVTESNLLTNIKQANITLSTLQSMGCLIAIDDFGTGYASYSRLREMNADIMKIDGSFIRNILTSSQDYQIVESICQLARMKKMLVVAGFVGTEETRAAVLKLGVDYVQGWVISRPQPLESLLPAGE